MPNAQFLTNDQQRSMADSGLSALEHSLIGH